MKSIIALCISLVFVNLNAQNWVIYDTTNSMLPHDMVEEIKPDSFGNVWVATNAGLVKIDREFHWTIYNESNTNIFDEGLDCVLPIDSNAVWIGTRGAEFFDGSSFTRYDFDAIFGSFFQGLNIVNQIEQDSEGNIWFATNGGLVKYDGSSFSRFTTSNGLFTSNMTYSVKWDDSKNVLWVGTYSDGLLRYDGSTFTQIYLYEPSSPFFALNQVNEIFIENDGDIWVTGYGIFEFDGDSLYQKSYYVSEIEEGLFWGLNIDQNDKLWIGSDYLHGLFMYDGASWYTYDSINSPIPDHCTGCLIPSNHIESIYVDPLNNKWLATWTGLIIYNEEGVNVGSKENQVESKIKLYPNPVINRLNIRSSESLEKVVIYNLQGQIVQTFNQSSFQVNCKPGYYSAHVYLKTGQVAIKPFVKSTR